MEPTCADIYLCPENNTEGAALGQSRGQGRRMVRAEAGGGKTAMWLG